MANRKLLRIKLIDIETTFVARCGRVAHPELPDHSDLVFSAMIEAMLEVRRTIFEGCERLHRVLLQVVQHDANT